jgi:peptidoglycan/LPS O-acetylase OafA/YrhL
MGGRILPLESLRGLAAISVALYHFPSSSILYFSSGHLGVNFFFVLSGFVISLNYYNKINNLKSYINFIIKRFYRIYPIHLFTLTIVLLVQILKYFYISILQVDSGTQAFGSWYQVNDFILNVFLFQNVLSDKLTWNAAAWSISTEFYTYIIFAFIFLIFKKYKILIIFVIYILIFQIQILKLPISPFFYICISHFSNGVFCYYLFSKIKYLPFKIIYFDKITNLIIFLLLYLFIFQEKIFYANLNLVFFIMILSLSLSNNNMISKILNTKALIYLGTISYSFYMIHQIVLYLTIQILRFLFKVNFMIDKSSGVVTSTGKNFEDTIITLSFICISFFIAHFMHKYIEVKWRWSRL